MSFFEVQTSTPLKMDMGRDLPLRFRTRPALGQLPWPLMGFVLFVVIPIAYALANELTWAALLEEWPLPVVAGLATLLTVPQIVLCVSTRLEVVVTDSRVTLRGAGVLKKSTWDEPLANYIHLRCEHRHHADWIGAKDEYGIFLVHDTDPERSIVVHWGRDTRRFEDRLARYAQLLQLPVQREEQPADALPQHRAAR
ncbi:hypothetical protein LZ198_07890 [Myxococcus sp. K15C18031901]|uniref:hypothetical protein n=1 Tax=Myxococcus dinghuensis TaxID=2906761 RepID=UPI0020A79937|nr:hypothetical protein [Myxococcus dinghuensis]MCP3098794.1 hypothetical protein [Myxococcus dinghuensis]